MIGGKQKAKSAQGAREERAPGKRENNHGEGTGRDWEETDGGGGRELREGALVNGGRRRKGIRRAREVPRKSSTRDKRRQRKTRNFEKAHDTGFGDSTQRINWSFLILVIYYKW